MVFGQSLAQEFESIFRRVDNLQQVEIGLGYSAGVDKGLEVEDAIPVLAAVDHHQNLLGQFVGLSERENLEQLVHGAEASRENHQTFCQVGKPELPHKEIVKLEVQGRSDVGVRALFEGQGDVQSDGFAAGFVRAQIGGFHDAGASSGGDHEAVPAGR